MDWAWQQSVYLRPLRSPAASTTTTYTLYDSDSDVALVESRPEMDEARSLHLVCLA